MTTISPDQARELRRRIGPEVKEKCGRTLRPDNTHLQRLTRECGIASIADIDLRLFVQLIVESGWVSMRRPKPDVDAWIAVRYLASAKPKVDPLLGSERVVLEDVMVIGGTGWPLKADRVVRCLFSDDRIEINTVGRQLFDVPYDQVEGIQLHGGTEVGGGGFVGGGFGLDGAAVGMLAATALNALTTTATTYTLLEVTTRNGELFLFYAGAEPAALRIMLSHAFTAIRVAQRLSAEPKELPSGEQAEGFSQ